MLTVKEAQDNIGNKVIYERPYCDREEGIITSVNSERETAFVRYGSDVNSKCTNLDDLILL